MQQHTPWFRLFPEQASTFAWQVDALFVYILAITIVFGVGTVIFLFYFALRYRETEKFASPPEIHGSTVLEITWSVIPLILAMTIFVFGTIVFYNLYRPPTDTMDIYVVGKQWMWKFQHQTGQREINELHIPVGRKVKLTMTTEDVLHDVYIPDFRTKADVVPGRYTYIWFEATKPGKYHLYCAEYCGLNHSGMGGWVYVMEQRDFDNWLSGNPSGLTPVEAGKDLFQNKLGCVSCHQDNNQGRGPKMTGVFGSDVTLMTGDKIKADETYVRDSIVNPTKNIVQGYQPIMPTFKGQVTEEQMNWLVAYIKSLGTNQAASSSAPATAAPAASTPANAAPAVPAPKTAANSSPKR